MFQLLMGVMDYKQVDDTEVINFLLSTEIIPLCLRTMEMGSELSKTVSSLVHFFRVSLNNLARISCRGSVLLPSFNIF